MDSKVWILLLALMGLDSLVWVQRFGFLGWYRGFGLLRLTFWFGSWVGFKGMDSLVLIDGLHSSIPGFEDD